MLGEFAKYAFCALQRKRRNLARSVLVYVSSKIPALTHAGCKSRVCLNQPDRLTNPTNTSKFFFLSRFGKPPTGPCLFAFAQPPAKAGCGVALLNLAGANAKAMARVGLFAKYAFCALQRKRRDLARSVLVYVNSKIPALTLAGGKSRVCLTQPDRITPNQRGEAYLRQKMGCLTQPEAKSAPCAYG